MMIGNNVQHDVSLEKYERVQLISNKRRDLDEITSQIQNEILQCFKRLEDVLKTRERRLMRQVEAVHRQQLSLIQSELLPSLPLLTVNLHSAQELEQQILNFGSIELEGNTIAVNDSEPYKVVDYQEPHKDHINLDKSLQNQNIEAQKKRDLCLKTPLKLDLASLPKKIEFIDNCSSDHFVKSVISEHLNINTENNNLFKDEHCMVKDTEETEESQKTKVHDLSESSEHSNQIQQWLKQILMETETEPTVQDQEHFSEIAKSQLSLET